MTPRAFGDRGKSPDPLNLPPTAAQIEAADPKIGAGLCTGRHGVPTPEREPVIGPDGDIAYDVIDGKPVDVEPMGQVSDVHGPYTTGGRAA
jgi:hypothetical protein